MTGEAEKPGSESRDSKAGSGSHGSVPLQILGYGAGITVFAYALGGAYELLRFGGKGIPGTTVVSLLSSRQIVEIGGLLVAFLAAGVIVSVYLEFEVQNRIKIPRLLNERKFLGRLMWGSIFALAAVFTVAYVAIVFTFVHSPVLTINATGAFVAGAFAAFFSGLLGAFVAAVAGSDKNESRDIDIPESREALASLPRSIRLALPVGVISICGACLALFMPLRLSVAMVQLSDGACLQGLYLDSTADGIHLVDGSVDGKAPTIVTVEPSEIADVQLGNPRPLDRVAVRIVPCPPVVRSVSANVRTADATALIYEERVIEERAELASVFSQGWRSEPPLPNRAFDVPASDGGAFAAAFPDPGQGARTLLDLGSLHGQLEITYDGWVRSKGGSFSTQLIAGEFVGQLPSRIA